MTFKLNLHRVRDKLLTFYSICLFLTSCNNIVPPSLNFKQTNIKSKVGLISEFKGDNVRGTKIEIENDSTYVSYINLNKLKIFKSNLSEINPKFSSIAIPKDLLDVARYGTPTSFSLFKDSLITIFQNKKITLIDLFRKEIIFQKDIEFRDSSLIAFQDFFMPIQFSKKRNSIFSQIIHFYRMNERTHPYDYEFHAEISCSDGTFKILPVKYPDSYGEKQFGQNSFAKTIFKGDSILYSFSNEPWIIIYDLKTNKITKREARSKYHTDVLSLKLDSDSLWDTDLDRQNQLTSFRYDAIFYDSWNKLYYRVFVKKMDKINSEGFFNTLDDRQTGIVVLNEEMEHVGEVELPDKGIGWYGVGREGFVYKTSFSIENDSLFYKHYVAILPLF